ncbi:amidase family protein [Pseudonocardia sp.]|uniref:amidase family protein n=1 Tax=Pseudonocardia sp. TaxID=60912 RepID=UPI0031FD5F3E
MQFTILGSGAIGGTVGAYLVRAGHDVLFCDIDADHVAAMNAGGLQIEGPVDTFRVPARAVLPDALPDRLERVIVAVKAHHTWAAAETLTGRLAPGGYVLSLQNGLSTGILAQKLGADRLIVGFVNFGADYLAPGRILHGNVATFRVGEPAGPVTSRVEELVAALPWAQATDNIAGFRWSKEAYGAMLFATAVTDLSIADALEDPDYRPFMIALAREVLAQSPVRPEPFDGFDPDDLEASIDRLVAFNRASAKSHSGIYRDLAIRKRPTEVADLDGLTGPLTGYVAELIRAIERGERVCERPNLDLLAAYERVERLGRPLNAVVALLPAPGRASSGPLQGTPVAVKDMIDIQGQPRGNGNPRDMAGAPADTDSPVVALLRAAAADVFATASLLEYAAGAPHPDIAEARNPADPAFTAGGSSGGSAALVGAGVCPAALGTDTGGSIRIPAHYCGVVGIKPSYGLVPVAGVEPLSPTLDHVGVLAADVPAARRVLEVLAGRSLTAVLPGTRRFGLLVDQLGHPAVEPGVRQCVLDAADELRRAGHQVVEVDGGQLAALNEVFGPIVLHEAWESHRDRFIGDPDHYGAATRRLLRSGSTVDSESYEAALRRREELIPAAAALLDGLDALLGPVVPYVAPELTPPMDTEAGELEGLFSAPYNVTGQPALSLPAGRTPAGLPVGLQLAAPIGADATLLAIAEVVWDCLAGSLPAPVTEP